MSNKMKVGGKPVKVEASTENNILIFTITGRIWQGELASVLRLNIDNAKANGIDTVHVIMSSEGGSTFEAEDIKNELKRMPKRKLRVGAICASAATNIALIFQEVEAYSTSQFMIHKPSSWCSGNEDQVAAELQLLKNITQNYRSVYAKKFNKTEVEIEELWTPDYWMTAAQAKELGLITTIIDENLEYNEETINAMVACGAPIVPAISSPTENKNSNENTMDINQLKSALGMSATATEQEVLDRVADNKKKADQAQSVEAAQKEQQKTNAERIVNQAILDKKITADLKDVYVSLHIQDPAQTEAALKAMPGVKPASESINHQSDGAVTGRENWTVEDYLEKDPKALDALIASDPDVVRKMNAVYINKK